MYYLKTEHTFDSAHFLKGYDGKCKNLHGHCWKVIAEIRADKLETEGQTRGMIIDFSDLKKAVRSLCDEMDHCLIYEKDSLKQTTLDALNEEGFLLVEVPFRPTAENFARYFYERLQAMGLPVNRIEVYETETNCAAYTADQE